MSIFQRFFAVILLISIPSSVFAQACGAPRDIALGNGYSDLQFAIYALKPATSSVPETSSGFRVVPPTGGDDTNAIQNALNRFGRVWLQEGRIYTITRQLVLRDGAALIGGGDGATLHMRLSNFGNFRNFLQNKRQIYEGNHEALRLTGQGITVQNLYIVKEYLDDTYVAGINIREARDVVLDRLRLRGFSLVPGIISVQSGHNVSITNSIIHASCSDSKNAPSDSNGGDFGAFQITGITVDDMRPQGTSSGLTIRNNVIRDLWITEADNPRGDQTDGINIHQSDFAASPAIIESNHIANVAEAIDVFGKNILIRDNALQGHHSAVKLIHGARQIHIVGNRISGQPRYAGIGAYEASAGTGIERQVQDVWIIDNEFNLGQIDVPAVMVSRQENFPPTRVSLIRNRFEFPTCAPIAIDCPAGQCWENNNEKTATASQGC